MFFHEDTDLHAHFGYRARIVSYTVRSKGVPVRRMTVSVKDLGLSKR